MIASKEGSTVPSNDKHPFILRHSLPESYLQQASVWFDPIVDSILVHKNSANRPLIIGVSGCQGSGKTTLADYLSESLNERGLSCVAISIDDFYLTLQQRQQLAEETHPLLLTRGVPGTHDLPLALSTLNDLINKNGVVTVPRFDKSQDDRYPKSKWSVIEAPVDIVILEGWCVGVKAQKEYDLIQPINKLESLEDKNGEWRHFVNHQLETSYAQLWSIIDQLIMLKAPSFDSVYQWRLEQEHKLSQAHSIPEQDTHKIMTPKQIKRFIQHYERLTRYSLSDLAGHCHHVLELNMQRQIISHKTPRPVLGDER